MIHFTADYVCRCVITRCRCQEFDFHSDYRHAISFSDEETCVLHGTPEWSSSRNRWLNGSVSSRNYGRSDPVQHRRTRKFTARTLQPWTMLSEPMALGHWPTTLGPWPLALGPRSLALGPWPLALDLVNKCQSKRHSHRKRRDHNVTLENARVLRSPINI